LNDIAERFKGFNQSLMTLSFLFDLSTLKNEKIQIAVDNLKSVFPEIINENLFVEEIKTIRTQIQGQRKKFKTFSQMAQWILNSTDQNSFQLLHYFMSLILVLPFCTADCERSFSAMNFIKSKYRNRLKEILKASMLIYTANKQEIENLNLDKLAQTVATTVWSKTKRKKSFAATDDYMRQFV
jgi:hypothetical protein